MGSIYCPFLGKRYRRETPRQGYTTTTAHRRNHWNSFMLSLFTTQCTSMASRVHMCAVSDWCVCSRFKKGWLRRPFYRRTLPLACSSAGTWTRRVYLTSQVRMPREYFFMNEKHFRLLFLQRNFFLFRFRPFSVAFFSLAHFLTECVLHFFMDQWFSARLCSAAGALRRAQ